MRLYGWLMRDADEYVLGILFKNIFLHLYTKGLFKGIRGLFTTNMTFLTIVALVHVNNSRMSRWRVRTIHECRAGVCKQCARHNSCS